MRVITTKASKHAPAKTAITPMEYASLLLCYKVSVYETKNT